MSVNPGGGMDALARKANEATQQAGGPGQGAVGGEAPAPADADVQRFQDALNAGAPNPAPDASAAGAPSNAPDGVAAPRAAPTESMADRILRGISSADQKVAGARAEAAAALDQDNVSQADLLRANFAMMESSTFITAVSKSTEKLTSAAKTLQQG